MGINIGLYPGKLVFMLKPRICKLTLQQTQSRFRTISYESGHREICESVIRLAIDIPKTYQIIGSRANGIRVLDQKIHSRCHGKEFLAVGEAHEHGLARR